jgi:hypothetical protein
MRLIEDHLNISHHKYASDTFQRYNGHGCYGWNVKCKSEDDSLTLKITSHDDYQTHPDSATPAQIEQVFRFFSPFNRLLYHLAENGLIRRPPPMWAHSPVRLARYRV